MVGEGQVKFDAGTNLENFDEDKLLNNLKSKHLIFKVLQNVLV